MVEGEVVVLAASRRRYVCRIPLAEAKESHYSHNTGELVIAPAEENIFNRIALKPSEAITVLRAIGLNA